MIYSEIKSQIKKIGTPIIDYLGSLFLTGLLTLLPLIITFTVFSFSFHLLKNWLAPLQRLSIPYVHSIPHAEIVLVLVIIFFSGFILKSLLLRSLVELCEKIISSIPVVSPVFMGVKQLVHAFSPSDTLTFKKVVFIEFPRKNMYTIGFLTGEMAPQFAPTSTDIYYNIFIPTTPNPTTGYFIMVTKNELLDSNLTTQEAMALIISGGIIQPNKPKQSA